MNNALLVIQIIISVALITSISIQTKGGGLARSLSPHSFTRRGLEKLVFRGSFVLVFIFIVSSIWQFLV